MQVTITSDNVEQSELNFATLDWEVILPCVKTCHSFTTESTPVTETLKRGWQGF